MFPPPPLARELRTRRAKQGCRPPAVPTAAIADFKFPDPHWRQYPEFVALQLAYLDSVRGTGRLANIAGWSSVALALGALVIHGRRLLRPRPPGLEPPAGLFLSQVIVTIGAATVRKRLAGP